MAYSDFSLGDLRSKLGLSLHERERLFANVQEVEPSAHLQETLAYHTPLATSISTEKARSELIVAPVLVEVVKHSPQAISLFSGVEFTVDKAQGLNGVCDYLISLSPQQLLLDTPVISIVEAKNDNLKSGLGQCVAEMLAAQIYNEQKGSWHSDIYGAVTTGSLWNFLRLQQRAVWVDVDEYHISHIAKILGIFFFMVNNPVAGDG